MKIFIYFFSFLLTILACIQPIYIRNYDRNFIYAEPWLKNMYKAKDYINTIPTTKQRLLIFSGSNSLFGFNGEIIDKNTKFKPINYATHAGLPLNFLVDKIIEQAKDGDIIFMPLEFGYYERDRPDKKAHRNDLWYVSNMMYWGDSYRKYISFFDIINVYVKSSPPLKSLDIYAKNAFKEMDIKSDEIFDIHEMFKGEYVGYNYKSLNIYGDFCTQQGILSDEKLKNSFEHFKYLKVDSKVSSFFLSEFARLESFAKSHNIKIFLTYPATMESEYFSLQDSNTYAKIENLISQLSRFNIKIYGDFKDFHFEQKYFFDTNYHLNANGATLRTKNFIKLLQSLEKSGEL